MNPENHCAECGKTNVQPHPFYPPIWDGFCESACLCEDCGDDASEEASERAERG